MYRNLIAFLLNHVSDSELEEDLVAYLTEDTREKIESGEKTEDDLVKREKIIREDLERVRENIIDAFDRRGRGYNKVAIIFAIAIVTNSYLSLGFLLIIGLLMSLFGSIVLARGIIHGIYWTYALLVVTIIGNPSKYYEIAILNDTVDGIYGVSFLIAGFILQIIAVVT